MTPANAEAEAGLFFSSMLLYHFKYMQRIRSVLGQGTNKAINKTTTTKQSRDKLGNKQSLLVFRDLSR